MLEGDARPADGRTQSVWVTAEEWSLWGQQAGPPRLGDLLGLDSSFSAICCPS